MNGRRHPALMTAFSLCAVAALLLSGCGGGSNETRSATPSAPTPLPPQLAGTPVSGGNIQELIKQGQAALDADNLGEAERLFKSAVAQASNSADAQYGLGNVYFRQGRLTEAETAYRAALAVNPNLTMARSNLGVVYYQQNRMQEAEAAFSEALKLKPDDATTLYLLAAVKIQNKQYTEAETLLNRAKAAAPALAEVYYGLGALYGLQGRKQEAIAAFEKFLSLGTAQDPQSLEEARKQLQQLKGQ